MAENLVLPDPEAQQRRLNRNVGGPRLPSEYKPPSAYKREYLLETMALSRRIATAQEDFGENCEEAKYLLKQARQRTGGPDFWPPAKWWEENFIFPLDEAPTDNTYVDGKIPDRWTGPSLKGTVTGYLEY